MKVVWSVEKNNELKTYSDRNICFEDIVAAIEAGGLLDDVSHPNPDKYPSQRVLVVLCRDYVYGVPYVVQNDGYYFLKTAFPSRLLKKRYIVDRGDSDERT